MQDSKRATGAHYEEMAVAFLKEQGYRVRQKNFYAKHGEIDIIADKDEYLCFVEVKYRRNGLYGSAAEAVSYYKQRAICLSAREYLWRYHLSENTPMRFDVVSIQGSEVALLENAFEYHI